MGTMHQVINLIRYHYLVAPDEITTLILLRTNRCAFVIALLQYYPGL
jgi:hypothetical protein